MPGGRESRRLDLLWLAAFALLASAYCVLAARQLGATFDEPFYAGAGLERWRTGSYWYLLPAGTMPLPTDVQTLPLYMYERITDSLVLGGGENSARVLPYVRLPTLGFLWLALIYAWRIGLEIAGRWGGRLAVAFVALDPTVLAHAGLATTDMAIAACLLPLAYHFARNRDETRWSRRVGLPALLFGVAILAKASAIVFGPVTLLAIELRRAWVAPDGDRPFGRRVRATLCSLAAARRDLWQIGAIGSLIACLYCGTDFRINHDVLAWARRLPVGPLHDVMVWLAVHVRLSPNAIEAILFQVMHDVQGHRAYIAGVSDPHALWFYFPLLLTIKLTVTCLIVGVVLLLLRRRALANWPLMAFAALVLLSVTFRVQIGIRMILPVVVLGLVGLGAAAAHALAGVASPRTRVALATVLAAGLAWNAVTILREFPHALAYTNALWGGTDDGYRVVSDANYDWGQGLPELRRWQERTDTTDLAVWYFGADPRVVELPMRFLDIRAAQFKTPAAFINAVRGHTLAVSTTYLYGAYAVGAEVPVQVLRARPPIGRTQMFLIYRF